MTIFLPNLNLFVKNISLEDFLVKQAVNDKFIVNGLFYQGIFQWIFFTNKLRFGRIMIMSL